MTIAFGAIGTRLTAGTTSVTVAYPTGITAGQMLLMSITVKPNTATITTPSGWTALGNVAGGTGTAAADTGTTRTAMFYKVAAGTESGTQAVTLASTPNAVTGWIARYTKTGTNWATPYTATGTVTTHGTGWSATSIGTLTAGLAVGDFVVISNGNDTDTTTAYTSPTLATQTSGQATFSALTNRLAQGGATTGFQAGCNAYDCSVSAVNNTTLTTTTGLSHTLAGGPAACGATVVVVLREVTPSGTAISALTDNFDDGTIDSTKWPTSYGSPTESGGVLNCPAPATAPNRVGLATTATYDLTGGQVVVRVPDRLVRSGSATTYTGIDLMFNGVSVLSIVLADFTSV